MAGIVVGDPGEIINPGSLYSLRINLFEIFIVGLALTCISIRDIIIQTRLNKVNYMMQTDAVLDRYTQEWR